MRNKIFPLYLTFLCMGFGDVVGPLVGLAKDSFILSYTMAQLIPFTGFLMFGILSIPIGIFQDRLGKKIILNLGLLIALTGLLLAILSGLYGKRILLNKNDFYVVLLSILSLCAGVTILQVVGNPLVYDVSPEGKYSKNLSLAQFFKSIGSSIGFLLPPLAMSFFHLEWSILFPFFSSIVLLTIIAVRYLNFEERDKHITHATLKSCLKLLKDKYVLIMVLSIFLYVGTEVSMSSTIPIYLKEYLGISGYSLWLSWALFFLPLVIGRYTGSIILNKIKPTKFLIYTSILSIIGLSLLFTSAEYNIYIGILLTGFGFANIFPLIFSITIEKIPNRANELSGLMISAISGGAIIPLIMGSIIDAFNLLYILITAIFNHRIEILKNGEL